MGCLKCAGGCGTALSPGQKLKEVKGGLYCPKCYTRQFAKTCSACGNKIAQGKFIKAKQGPMHPKCFACVVCASPIGPGTGYNMVGPRIYCSTHYLAYATSNACRACGVVVDRGPATDGAAGTPAKRPLCDSCADKPPARAARAVTTRQTPTKQRRRSGAAAREPAATQAPKRGTSATSTKVTAGGTNASGRGAAAVGAAAAPTAEGTCASCHKALSGSLVSFGGKWYHVEHLTCTGPCGRMLKGVAGGVVNQKGKPYCKQCALDLFAKRCAKCKKPIEGRYTIVKGKAYHRNHFTCTQCKQALTTQYHVVGDKPYCLEHHTKLLAERQCYSCHIIAANPDDVFAYKDGRVVCRKCDSSAVWEKHELQASFADARGFFAELGFKCMRTPLFESITVKLATPDELVRQTKAHRTCGTTGRPLGLTMYSTRVTKTPHRMSTGGPAGGAGGRSSASASPAAFTFSPADVAAGHPGTPGTSTRAPGASDGGGSDASGASSIRPSTTGHVRPGKLHVSTAHNGKVGTRSHHVNKESGVVTTREHTVNRILVMTGLPRVRMASVLAHEVCHAFIAFYRLPTLDPSIVEGLCELWAYEYLRQRQGFLGCDESGRWMELMRNSDDPVYGGGLRKVLASYEAFRANGAAATTGKAGRKGRPPPGAGAGSSAGAGSLEQFAAKSVLPQFMRYVKKHRGIPRVNKQ